MSVEWIVPDWAAPANVRAVVTTRPLDLAAADRARLREALHLPSEPRWLRQVHGTGLIMIPPPFTGEGSASEASAGGGNTAKIFPEEPQADASRTRTPGVVLAILTADCLPVLFCARDGLEIAAAHAGWRGLSAGVLENTLVAMHTPREDTLAWLGPAIGPRSYEVGDEVRDVFLEGDRSAAEAFQPARPDHWRCDLYALARQRLRAAGVRQIFGGGFDTFTDPRFHSYRRDGARSGRFATLIFRE